VRSRHVIDYSDLHVKVPAGHLHHDACPPEQLPRTPHTVAHETIHLDTIFRSGKGHPSEAPACLIAVIVLWGRGASPCPQHLISALLPPGSPSDLSRLIPALAMNDSHGSIQAYCFRRTPHHARRPARPRPMPSRFRGQSKSILTQYTLNLYIMDMTIDNLSSQDGPSPSRRHGHVVRLCG
jgi:hypothetical protein